MTSTLSKLIATRRMLYASAVILMLVLAFALTFVLQAAPSWITLLPAIPIVLLGMMFGLRGGIFSAAAAATLFLIWALTNDQADGLAYVHRPGVFFALGAIAGYVAHGWLGDFSPRRALLHGEIKHGIRHQEVVMYYQPVVDTASGRVLTLEALARWHHPKRGLVLPPAFLPAAETDRDTIWELTHHSLELALSQCSAWQDQGHEAGVSVNLSSVSFDRPELAAELSQLLSKTGLPANRLTLEVTEGAVMSDPTHATEVLSEIRGSQAPMIAIDDFGTGHSSLARLEQLPVDVLKIDRRFLADFPTHGNPALIRAIVDLAHALGLSAYAEGVEDERTLAAVCQLGCDAVQGFHLAKPMPYEDVAPWLARHVEVEDAVPARRRAGVGPRAPLAPASRRR